MISPAESGTAKMAPVDRWGTRFVWCAGAWVLVVGSVLLGYFLFNHPSVPNAANQTPDQLKETLQTYRILDDEFQKSLASVFDLLVTKTALPVVTLMLGYLFGKRQN
jgi:hypothetical protein